MSFKINDRVRLRFGGPEMVVENVEGDRIDTFWFHDSALRRDSFLSANLMVLDGEPVLAPRLSDAQSADAPLADAVRRARAESAPGR